MIASLRDRLTAPVDALRQIAANPGLLRLEIGSMTWAAADGMYVVGLAILAYEDGGTPGVAIQVISRALPSIVLVPVLLGATNGIARDRLLRLALATRVACLLAATIIVTVAHSALVVILLLGAIDAVAQALLRPVRSTLLPGLARSPEELVAANVATSTGDALAAILGPGGAALLLVVGDVPATYAAGTILMAVAFVTVVPIRGAPDLDRRIAPASSDGRRSGGVSVLDTARRLLGMPHARVIVLLLATQRFVRGVINVAIVAAAFDLLHIGDSGVGILTAAIGLGGLLGGGVALGLVGRDRLGPAFAAGVIAWGAGIMAAGAVPYVILVVAVLSVAGIGKTVLDTSGFTLLQRTVPNDQRSNVFGLLEGVIAAAQTVGPVAAAILIGAVGAGWTLVIAGALPMVLVAVSWPVLRSADDESVIPQPALRLLTGVAMFRPLQLTTLETLARQMVERQAPAGSDVVRQGEAGDAFYIVASGRLTTVVDGMPVNVLGPGDSFGEIALLRASLRTATVRALEDSRLVDLDGEAFLAAVASTGDSAAAADAVVQRRLTAT